MQWVVNHLVVREDIVLKMYVKGDKAGGRGGFFLSDLRMGEWGGGKGASFNIYFLGVKSTVTITPFQRLIVRY